jgi:hypothetical protein
MSDDRWFDQLAAATLEPPAAAAPPRLKSKIYSAVVTRMAGSGPLLDLAATKDAGGQLCVFENLLTVLPLGTDLRSMNPCRMCHARALGENVTRAPIFWPGCPYSEFHHG